MIQRTARYLGAAVLAVAFTGCTTLGGVIGQPTRTVTWRCDGRVTVRVQDAVVRVECPSGPAPLVVVEGQVER